jgi:hypothetical protein
MPGALSEGQKLRQTTTKTCQNKMLVVLLIRLRLELTTSSVIIEVFAQYLLELEWSMRSFRSITVG